MKMTKEVKVQKVPYILQTMHANTVSESHLWFFSISPSIKCIHVYSMIIHVLYENKPKNEHFSPDLVRGVLIFEVLLFDKTGHEHVVYKYFYT